VSEGLLNGLLIIPVLAVLILVHEIGHFVAARSVGVKVEEFGIGIPPRLKGWTRNGVIWSINWIPFGGFVRVKGEDANDTDPGSMNTKGPLQRAFFLVAGSAMNILLVVLLMGLVVALQGRPLPSNDAIIIGVEPNSPAAQAGLEAGDRFVSIDGVPVERGDEIREVALASPGQSLPVVVERDGVVVETSVTPRSEVTETQGPTGVRLSFEPRFEPVPATQVVPLAISESWNLAALTVDTLRMLVTGEAPWSGVAGPFGMGQGLSETLDISPLPFWVTLARFTAVLSINLAILNLLPLPALDGGRLLFVLVEILRGGRRIAPEREGLVHLAGFVILIGLMLVITFADLGRLFSGESFFQR